VGEPVDLCWYHGLIRRYPFRARKYDRSRFALLVVSPDVKHDVLWVLHNRIRVDAEMTALLSRVTDSSQWGAFNRMWRSVVQFRLLDFRLPTPVNGDSLTCLGDGITQLFEYWDKQDMHAAEPSREVTIRLGGMFDANPAPADTGNKEKIPLETIWQSLEQSVQLIVVKDRNVKWKFTVSDTEMGSADGQKYLNRFRALLGKVGIEFEGKSNAYTLEQRSTTGGTHVRFLD
jgi:hypothetical protein